MDGAKAAVTFSLVSEEETLELAADEAFLSYFSGTTAPQYISEVMKVRRLLQYTCFILANDHPQSSP